MSGVGGDREHEGCDVRSAVGSGMHTRVCQCEETLFCITGMDFDSSLIVVGLGLLCGVRC